MMPSPRSFRRSARRLSPALLSAAAFAGTALTSADALAGGLPRVALVASASTSTGNPQMADVQTNLLATGRFSGVDIYNVSDTPPRPLPGGLGLLMTYDAVMVWSNNNFTGAENLGDLFADYADTGKGVVLAVSAVTSNNASRQLQGRWASGGYGLILPGDGTTNAPTNVGTIHVPDHPLMTGVIDINTNLSIRTRPITPIAATAVRVADWSDGAPLAVISSNPALNRRADIGLYPPSNNLTADFWIASTDGWKLMANALEYAAAGMGGTFPPAADIAFSNLIGVAGSSVVITATVTPGVNPASTGIAVTADLSAFGGSSAQALAPQGGNVFTYTLNIPPMQAESTYAINFTVTDTQLRSTPARASLLVIPPAPPGYTAEAEPNETKANATPATITAGGGVYGITTGSSVNTDGSIITPDYFLLTLTPLTPGIYRHTMILETDGPVGHGASLRGYSQGSGGINLTSDTAVQTSVTTTFIPRSNAWYGFGGAEQMFYRVIGNSSSTSPYRARLETEQITPADLGTDLIPGEITISRFGHTNTVDMLVYNQNFQAVSDFNVDGGGTLTRTFAPGTYYLAVSNVNTADHRASGPGSTSFTGPVLHFPGSVANSSINAVGNLSLEFFDGTNSVTIFVTKDIFFGVAWVKFVVGTAGTCPGNFNADGSVDLLDLLAFNALWSANLGQVVTPGQNGDYNGDGNVDLLDLLAFNSDWSANLGQSCP